MDDACYATPANVIVAVRGSRVYQCSPVDGSIVTSVDFQQLALSPSSICYDTGTARCFAVCFQTGSFDTFNALATRQLTRINPSPLAVDLTLDISTILASPNIFNPFMETGVGVVKASGGQIYGMGLRGFINTAIYRFQANAPAVPANNEFQATGGEYLSFALAVVGGNQRMYFNEVGGQAVGWWDFVTASGSAGPVDTRNRLSIEYAPTQGRFYCPEEFQFIDIYDTGGNFILQLDTLRSNFNGVGIARNPYTDMLYLAGGVDNTVIVLNPATNAWSVKLGFDLPFRFVFTPTKSFAVQQGAVGLKEVV